MLEEARKKDKPKTKELRVKIGVDYHLRLHALKLLRGQKMSDTVEEALDGYFQKVKMEQEEKKKEKAQSA